MSKIRDAYNKRYNKSTKSSVSEKSETSSTSKVRTQYANRYGKTAPAEKTIPITFVDGTKANVPKSAIPTSVAGSGFRMLETERKKQEPYGGMQGYAEAFDYYNARNLDVDATKKKISDTVSELRKLRAYDAPNEVQKRADLLDEINTLERNLDKHYNLLASDKANAEAQKRREYLMNLDIPATEKEISTFPKQIEDAWNSGKFENWRDAELSLKEREETLRRDITEASRLQRLKNEFEPMMSAPDFDTTSAYTPTKSGRDAELVGDGNFAYAFLKGDDFAPSYSHTGYTNDMYEYINGNEDVKRMINATQDNSGDWEYLNELTDDERKLYNSITSKEGAKKSSEYIDLLKPELLQRQRERIEKEARRMGKVHPIMSSVATVAASPLKGLSLVGQGLDYIEDGEIDKNAWHNKFTYIPKAMREGVTEVVERNWGAPGSFFYNTGMSIAEFLFTTGISGGSGKIAQNIALGIMGSGAAADTTLSALDRGLSSDQAMALGIISGATEIITEKISLNALFDEAQLGENAFKYFLNNAFEEGREEGISGLTNMIADVIISKDKSEWQRAIDEYVMRGESQNKAFALALADQAASLGLDVLGGMLSGASMAALPVAAKSVIDVVNRPKEGDVGELVDIIKQNIPEAQISSFEIPTTQTESIPEAQMPRAEVAPSSETPTMPQAEGNAAVVPEKRTPMQTPIPNRSVEATERTLRFASTFGDNGARAFENVLPDATPEQYGAFSQIYLHSLGKSKISAETLEQAKSVLPQEAIIAAESSGKNDALVAEQAVYFGENAKLVRDDNLKKANLKRSEERKLDALAKVSSTQILFVEELTDENGDQVNADYSDGVLRISLKAQNPYQVATTHEAIHRLREIAPEEYYSLAQHVGTHMSDYFYDKAYVETKGVYADVDTHDIREEIVADAFSTIMGDKGRLENFVKDNRGTWEKIRDIIHDLIVSIKRAMHKNSRAKLTDKQRFVFGELLQDYEAMENALNDALERTAEKIGAISSENNENLSATDREAVEALGDGADVVTNENGEMLIATNKDKHTIVYSKNTYDNGGRNALLKALKENGHTQEEIDNTLSLIDDAADYLTILAAGYAKTHGYTALSDNLVADIITNVKTGKQVLSAIVNNGDYPINIDLALICKKRVAYMRLMSRLIDDGVFDQVDYNGEAIAKVNEILRDDGFETACLGCFVESRRLQFQTWAETLVSEWNEEVDKRISNAGNFNFTDGIAELTDEEMDALAEELKNAGKKNDQGNLNLGKGSVQTKMGKLLDKVPSLRKHLTVADLLKPEGLTALRAYDSTLFSLVKSRYGAASPKVVQEFNPYASEIAMMTFSTVKNITSNAVKGSKAYRDKVRREMGGTPKKQKGETVEEFKARKKKFNTDLENEALRRYLYDIGGARIQSFSDFMIENVFDYMQIFADLSAKRLPLHGYTKEIIALRLFGMTGAKWNGSLIAHVDRNMGKENAGLLPASEAKNGNAILVHTKDGDFAIGFDDYARNKATNGDSFIQSIGMKDIIALQYDPRYSPYVGNITIGVSDNQILAMLDSPLFRFIIPYHSSGMLPQFAKLVGVDLYNDYQAYQNTTVKEWFDVNGNPTEPIKSKKKGEDGKEEVIKVDTSYNYNAEVQKTGDPKKAAQNYLEWCSARHPVYDGDTLVGYATFSPKFSDSPYGNDFTTHENYYKLLQDFNNYDNITEEVALQGAVTMNFPSEQNRLSESEMEAYKQRLRDTGIFSEKEIEKYAKEANKTFKELIEGEVKNRAEYQKIQTPKWDGTVNKVETELLANHKRKKNSRSWSNVDSEGRTLSEGQQEYFKDSKVRDENGNLLVVYHGTPNKNVNIFSYDYVGTVGGSLHGYGFYFSDSKKDASLYAQGMGEVKAYYINIQNPIYSMSTDLIDRLDELFARIPSDAKIKLEERHGDLEKAKSHYKEYIKKHKNGVFLSSFPDSADISPKLFNLILGHLGYDGIIHREDGYSNEYVVFYSDQAKLTSNTKPTPSSDIRYSRSWRDDGKTVDDYLGELNEKYGTIPKGEKPARAIEIPLMTEDGKFVGQTVRTILEAKVTPDEAVPTIKELVADGTFSFDRYSDEEAMADADDYIDKEGWDDALSQWKKDSDNGKMSKKHTAIGWALYNNAATAKDTETALDILDYMVRNQRNAGQALQATRILKKLSPTAQLYAAVRTAKRLETELNERYKAKNPQAEKEASEIAKELRKAKREVAEKMRNASDDRFVKQVGDALARQIVSMQNTKESRKTVFQEITAQLKKFAMEKLPKQEKAKPKSAIDILRDYIQNQDFYSEAWQIAQENLREQYADDATFADFINSGIGVDGKFDLQNAIFTKALVQSALDAGETKDIIRKQSALGFTKIVDSIADKLIRDTGASGEMAETIRDAAHGYVYDVLESGKKTDSEIVDAAIKSALKDIKTTIAETVLENKGKSVTKLIIAKLVNKYDFGIIEATNTADVISARFNEMCREYAQKKLETMFAEKPPRNRKTIPEQIELLASLGAFDMDSKFNALAAEKIFKLGSEVKVNEELAKQFMMAKTETSRKKVLVKIYQDIGSQLPSTFRDKLNAWRYLAMLGNTTTHLRNIFGNALFLPIVTAKSLTATAIESAVSFVSGGKFERTKGFSKNFSGLMKAAWNNYDTVEDLISGGGKFEDVILAKKEIEKGKRVFQGENVVSKSLEAARRFNSKALDVEDVWFSRPHYAFALAQYCATHKISESDISAGNLPKEAYDYAIKEAQKATFRDINAVSALVSKRFSEKGEFGRAGTIVNTMIDGVLPFRKTPANILVRGMEYSPLGLLKTISVDLYRVSKGKITGAEFIDNISAGLTGTALSVLGFVLAASHLIRGRGGDDEEEREFEKLMGHQEYELILPNGMSVTLDWIAPASLPFFLGVGMYERVMSAKDNKRDLKMEDYLQALSQISGPIFEMSFLQSLNDMIDSVGYAKGQDEYAFPKIISSIITSYLSSYVPTMGGKIERVGEGVRYQTYTDKNKWLTTDTQYTLGKALAKIPIPGVDYGQIPYIDAWGREEATGNVGTRLFNNFLNTAYTSRVEESAMEKELLKLYDKTGESKVLPSRANRYFTVEKERKDLTAKEYVKYATAKGQKSRELCEAIVSRDGYKTSSDTVKVKMIDNTYDYANQVAKTKVSRYKAEEWVKDIQNLKSTYNVPEDVSIMVKTFASEISGIKDRKGKTVDNSKSLLVADMIYKLNGVSLSQKQKLIDAFVSSKEVKKMNKALVANKLARVQK